jgi:choline dehydrogenase-like flavoprotein
MAETSGEQTQFTEREIQILSAICDTLAPALDYVPDPGGLYARKASDLKVPQIYIETIQRTTDPTLQTQLRLVLDLLDQSWFNALFNGKAKSFLQMTLDERTHLLRSWSDSRLDIQRYAFQAFKRLALYLFYAVLNDNNRNPNWDAIGYPGPLPIQSDKPKRLKPLDSSQDTTLSADVVIIGSGAGGGVVAGELSAAGLDVIVLEKGGYFGPAEFDGRELPSYDRMFENHALLTTKDLGVTVLAGSTLGGGTTINWAVSLRTPDEVLDEWQRDYGVNFIGKPFDKAFAAVSKRINVNENESWLNGQNTALERGSEALGYKCVVLPRNVKGCQDCGFCNFGCRYGAQQGTMQTYLHDAQEHGARIIVRTQVDRVVVERGTATGVEATVQSENGHTRRLKIKARAVVVSAGALHTPALLMRSGLSNTHIGRNLHLHPTSVTYGLYENEICGWSGPIMSRMVSHFANLDGRGYGIRLETAPIHPGLAALTLSWANGLQHKRVMRQLNHLSNIIIIARDREGGRVTLDRHGKPVFHYTLSDYDRGHLMRGIIEALRIHRAAGAYELSGPHTIPQVYRAAEDGDLETYLRTVQSTDLRKNSFALFSAHQMSSCRMGSNPARGAVDPAGETFEVHNLFVADASVLPTAVGVNPMLTIMTVSHLIAQHIKARLSK